MASGEDDATFFPQKLMGILADPTNQDAIAWLPDGQAFVIRDRELFVEIVLPKYFSRKARYSSFTRKLYRWYVNTKYSWLLYLSFNLT
jgi:HSF-type DNA-binding